MHQHFLGLVVLLLGSSQGFLFGTPGADLIAGGEGITTKGFLEYLEILLLYLDHF
jgi:hypothetical protein